MRKQTFTKFFRLVGVGSALLLPTLVWADTAPLVGDTYINPGIASNFGGLPAINVGGTGSQGLLLFDVTGIPAGNTITFARLRFYVNTAAPTGAVDLYTASAPWTESTVTGTSGVGPGTLVQSGIAIGGPGYITVDVTAQTQLWVNGTPNNGFLINANPGTTSIAIDTKENVATSHPAVLEIVLVGTGGATGPQGFAGAAGPTGPTGPTGPVGSTGANGPAGGTGATGGSGPVGPTGATGPTGALGAPGAVGANGGTGPQGNAGPAGPTGSTGALGAVGPVGGPGPAGATGPNGATGNQGAQGGTGSTGVTGPLGNTGATGTQGATGPVGAAGNTGNTGANGIVGGVGAAGAQGHAGPAFSNTFQNPIMTTTMTASMKSMNTPDIANRPPAAALANPSPCRNAGIIVI